MSNKKGYETPEMQVFAFSGDVVLSSGDNFGENFGKNPWAEQGGAFHE